MQEYDPPSEKAFSFWETFGFSVISMVLALFLSVIVIGETIVITIVVSQYERDHLPPPADCTTPAP